MATKKKAENTVYLVNVKRSGESKLELFNNGEEAQSLGQREVEAGASVIIAEVKGVPLKAPKKA